MLILRHLKHLLVQELACREIYQLEVVVLVQHDIARFEVAMDDLSVPEVF
jgi:hypothetical protein